jgi:hypothetical protein
MRAVNKALLDFLLLPVRFARYRSSMRLRLLALCLLALCLDTSGVEGATSVGDFVRSVDVSEAPEMKEIAERAKQIANENYPKVLMVLGGDRQKSPREIDIIFKKHLEWNGPGVKGPIPSYAFGARIVLSAEFLLENPTNANAYERNLTNLPLFLTHELAHVAQQYSQRVPFHWREAMADYVRYKLGYTNGWSCPQCSIRYPHFMSGPWCGGAFLLYLDGAYGSNLVRQLHNSLRRDSYSDKFFKKATGENLDALWAEFQNTPAYTPIAADYNAFSDAIRVKPGTWSKDYDARFQRYLRLPGVAFTTEAGKVIEELIQKRELPGIEEGEHGKFLFSIPRDNSVGSWPMSRTFHGQKTGDPSVYHYIVTRASKDAPWKLQRAWHSAPDGSLLEEYAIEVK